MYVHVEVLEGRGCLADLGAHDGDQLILRVGQPESWAGTSGMASTTLEAPIVGTSTGLLLPQKLADKIKHQVTKRAFQRDMGKYQFRLYVLKHDEETQKPKWLGIVAIGFLYLTAGYTVERWVPMKPATKTGPGDLRLRIVVKETEKDALAVLNTPTALNSDHERAENCCCEKCDPHFQLANPVIDYFAFEEKHSISAKAGRVIAKAFGA